MGGAISFTVFIAVFDEGVVAVVVLWSECREGVAVTPSSLLLCEDAAIPGAGVSDQTTNHKSF